MGRPAASGFAPPNAIVLGTGHVTMAQMIRPGFLLNLIGIALITALTCAVVVPWFVP